MLFACTHANKQAYRNTYYFHIFFSAIYMYTILEQINNKFSFYFAQYYRTYEAD